MAARDARGLKPRLFLSTWKQLEVDWVVGVKLIAHLGGLLRFALEQHAQESHVVWVAAVREFIVDHVFQKGVEVVLVLVDQFPDMGQ